MITVVIIFIIINFLGCFVVLPVLAADGYDLDDIFNPFRIYDNMKVNTLGAILISLISFVCATPVAIIFLIYKLCTIGRKR